MEREINSCPEFPYFGAKYPDARCIDGSLHDMDKCDENGMLYIMHEDHPCPFCRQEDFIENWTGNGYSKESVLKWIKEVEEKYGASNLLKGKGEGE